MYCYIRSGASKRAYSPYKYVSKCVFPRSHRTLPAASPSRKLWLAMRRLFAALLVSLAVLFIACGNDGSADPTPTGSAAPGTATLSPLEASLFAVTLQPSDLPDGLEASAPDFQTNEEFAGNDPDMLQRLIELGRQLSVDVQYIPTDRLEETTPLRGLQSSASAYTEPEGASESYQEIAAQASAVDWAAGYPELQDAQVRQVDESLGDESLWFRISGQLACSVLITPTPDMSGVVPSASCAETKLFIVDEVIFRTGRVRAYLKITTLFDPDAADDSYVDQIKDWADLITQRAQSEFPS